MRWRVIELDEYSPEMNMAIDEAILESVSEGKSDPTIRFYRWDREAVTMGTGQDMSILKDEDVKVVRRPSGGNAVYLSRDDLTYSVVAPKSLFNDSPGKAYRSICDRIVNAINSVSVLEAKLVGKNDVVLDGKKACGNAMEYSRRDVFLQHGCLFYNSGSKNRWLDLFNISEKDLKISFVADYLKEGFGSDDFYKSLKRSMVGLADDHYIGDISEEEMERAYSLVEEKYSNKAWRKGAKKGTVCPADIRDD